MFFNRFFNLFGKNLAMDLGTANTLIYTQQDGIVLNEPSVVALDVLSDEILAVGREAKEYLGRTPERIKAVRPLKDGVIADFEVTKTMISYFIKKVIVGMSLVKPRMIICVPAGITQVEKRAVIESGLQAGAREIRLIEEPMAAAIGAGLPIDRPTGNMVVDIGGGTTEVAILSLSAVSYAESVRVAGDELNYCIQRYMQDYHHMLIGENMAESAKITIGSAYPLDRPLSYRVSGKNIIDGTPKTVDVTDEEIRESIKEPLNVIITAIKHALEKTPPELISDIAENGLLLAGGGALLKGLNKLIEERTSIKVVVDEDPLTTVVRGTGYVLADEKQFKKVFIN